MIDLSPALLAAIFAAQVAQLGFQARLIERVSTLETMQNAIKKQIQRMRQ